MTTDTNTTSQTSGVGGGYFASLAKAISGMVDNNFLLQIITSFELFSLMDAYFEKSYLYSTILSDDAVQTYIDSLSITASNPQNVCVAAADNAKYQSDQQSMNNELNQLNNMMGTQESRISQENSAIGKDFSVEKPFTSLLKLTTMLIDKTLA
jgi:hypothetical protein